MATSSAYFSTADRPTLPPALRRARTIMLVWAAFAGVWAVVAAITAASSVLDVGVLIGAVLPELIGGALAFRMERLPRWPLLTITIVQIALAAGDLVSGSVRGIVQLVIPVVVLILLIRGYRSRTRTPDPYWQAGASLVEYAGLIVLAALILGTLVAVVPSPVQQGTRTAICKIFNGADCGASAQSGKNDSGGPKKAGTGGGTDKGGEKGKDDSKCHGFWGCAWHYTGGQVYGFGKGVVKSVYQMGDGLVTSIAHPSQFIKGLGYAATHPVDAAKSIFLGDAEKDWKNGDYGEAIGDVFTNTGSLFIPYADIATGAGDAGKVGKLGELGKLGKAGDVGKLGKLGDIAADGDRAAADAAKAAKEGDVGKAESAAKKADDNAKKAEDQGRRDGCKVVALGGVRPVPLVHIGIRAGVPLNGTCDEEEQNNLNKAEKDKKDADQAVADANLNVGADDAQAVRDRLAKSGETLKKTQNVGVAGYDIEGVGTGRVEGVSGTKTPSGTAPLPEHPKFNPKSPDGKLYRPTDSEYKILENISEKITPATRGKIRLYSERIPCGACDSVIQQFREQYPNIDLEVVHG